MGRGKFGDAPVGGSIGRAAAVPLPGGAGRDRWRSWSSGAPGFSLEQAHEEIGRLVRAVDGDKTARSRKTGELLAERAKAAGVEAVVFDRGGNKYHGRIAALAEGAREGGLAF